VPSIVNASPWARHIKWALKRAQLAKNTRAIVSIALELFERIKEQERNKPKPPPETKPETKPEDTQEPQEGDGSGDANGDGEGDPSGDSGKPANGDSGKPEQGDDGADGSGDSTDGTPADGDADADGSGDGDGDPSGENGGGYTNEDFEGGRDVEPSDFIEGELDKHAKADLSLKSRPSVGKPHFATFDFL
jgi:hypothetical protein